LIEILAEVYNLNAASKSVEKLYRTVIERVGTEFDILLKSPISELKEILDERLVLALSRMREGKVFVQPGYDGVYGKVLVFPPQDVEEETKAPGQQSLFTLQK
jgi:PHP family Zn ribbon phosphoesterase